MNTGELVQRIAAEDGGVVSRRHLVRSGADREQVDDLRRRGALEPIRRGWYALPGATPAVVATVKAGAVVACVSALKYRSGIWIPPNQKRLHVRWSEHRQRPKFTEHCRSHTPLATPVRAIDSLGDALRCAANCLDPDMFVAVLESTFRLPSLYNSADLRVCFDGAPGRVAGLVDRLDPLAGSGTESVVRFRLQSLRIKVRSQVEIPGVGRVDLLVGDRLIIECDSDGYHGGDQRKKDYRRDRTSTVGNYRVLRVDYDEVMDEWDDVLQEILALVRRGRHRGAPDF